MFQAVVRGVQASMKTVQDMCRAVLPSTAEPSDNLLRSVVKLAQRQGLQGCKGDWNSFVKVCVGTQIRSCKNSAYLQDPVSQSRCSVQSMPRGKGSLEGCVACRHTMQATTPARGQTPPDSRARWEPHFVVPARNCSSCSCL